MKALIITSLLFFSNLISAAEIHISPGRLVFDNSTSVQHVFLTNASNSIKRYVFLVRDVAQEPSGVMGVPSEPDENSLVGGVKISRRTAELKPGQQIAIAISVKGSMFSEGEYDAYFQVTAMDTDAFMKAESDLGIPMSIHMNRSFRLPLIYRKGSGVSTAKLFRSQYSNGAFSVIMGRKGDSSIHGSLRVYNEDNDVVAAITATTLLSTLSAREFVIQANDVEPGRYTIKFEASGVILATSIVEVD